MAPPSPTAEVKFCISGASGPGPGTTANGVLPVLVKKPDVLKRRSLVLRKLLDSKPSTPDEAIPLELDPGWSGFGSKAVHWILDKLQLDCDDIHPDGDCKPESLVGLCSALWRYECNPDTFKHLAEGMRPRSSRRDSSTPSIDQQSSSPPSVSRSGGPRCWQRGYSVSTCGMLITIAIVLGLDEILEAEIKTAVWGTKRDVVTSVPLAREIQAIRKDELVLLFDALFEEILAIQDKHERLAERIRSAFKQDRLGNLYSRWSRNPEQFAEWNPTPCAFLREIEYELLGSTRPQTKSAEGQDNSEIIHSDPKGLPDIDVVTIYNKWTSRSKSFKPIITGVKTTDEKERIHEILENLEGFIVKRQKLLAAEMMQWRNRTVQHWKDELEKLEGSDQKAQES